MDIVKRWFRSGATPSELVRTGRVTTATLAVVGCLLAPLPGRFEGVFQYIQLVWGFISPGVVTVFLIGLLVPRATATAATTALLLGVPIYAFLLWWFPEVAFLNHMAITAGILTIIMLAVTAVSPRAVSWRLVSATPHIDLTPDPTARGLGVVVLAATVGLYVTFW